MQWLEKEAKTILLKRKFVDSWFWDKYALNPYQGCQFGCTYCDSRSQKYYLPEDFSETVAVKVNAPELLDQRLTRARKLPPDVVATGSAGDSYQPAEQKYRLTRRILEVLLKHGYPVHMLTKSSRILDDLDVIGELGRTVWATVSVTITTPDSRISGILEPHASSSDERFQIIREIKQRAPEVRTGVLFLPIIPFISDSPAAINGMVEKAKQAGADYLLFGGMTLRDRQAMYFFQTLSEKAGDLGHKFSDLIKGYEAVYGFSYSPLGYNGGYGPNNAYCQRVFPQVLSAAEKQGLSVRIKRFIPDDYRKNNYRIAEILLNEAYFRQIRGGAWGKYHWAGENINNLEEPVEDIVQRGELRRIRNVDAEIEKIVLQVLSGG